MSHVWSDKKKIEVVTSWLALGKMPLVEAVTGVPSSTIKQWKLQPWWADMVHQIQTDSDQELDTKLSSIVDKSLEAVNERLMHGEFVLDPKTGKISRVPAKLRDVSRVAVDLLDKRDVLRAKPVKQQEQLAHLDILKKLAGEFSEWARIHLKKEKTIGETYDNAIHDERPQGLREGVQFIPQAEETKSQPGSA